MLNFRGRPNVIFSFSYETNFQVEFLICVTVQILTQQLLNMLLNSTDFQGVELEAVPVEA